MTNALDFSVFLAGARARVGPAVLLRVEHKLDHDAQGLHVALVAGAPLGEDLAEHFTPEQLECVTTLAAASDGDALAAAFDALPQQVVRQKLELLEALEQIAACRRARVASAVKAEREVLAQMQNQLVLTRDAMDAVGAALRAIAVDVARVDSHVLRLGEELRNHPNANQGVTPR